MRSRFAGAVLGACCFALTACHSHASMMNQDMTLEEDLAGADLTAPDDAGITALGPGIPAGSSPWVLFLGSFSLLTEIDRFAGTFAVIAIDADPDVGHFTADEVAMVKRPASNRVLATLSIGSCDSTRAYFFNAPPTGPSCLANNAGDLGAKAATPDSHWMNPANPAFRSMIVDYAAPRLIDQGADGILLRDVDLIDHGAVATDGPCDAACVQGMFDLLAALRAKLPQAVLVAESVTSDVLRGGVSGDVPVTAMLDGVVGTSMYVPTYNPTAETALTKWKTTGFTPGNQPYWLGTLDYVADCTDGAKAKMAHDRSKAKGFVNYAAPTAAANTVCYWGF
jgi:cysteinyl-tRNA synthetase